MSISNDPNLTREIILDHYQYPRNKRTVNDPSYISIHMDSDSCIDDFYIYLKVEDDKVIDCAFDGIGCTISTSSISIMTELIKGKSKDEAMDIINEYIHMVHHDKEEIDEDKLEEAAAFANTYKQANRIKCATIGWNGVKELLEKNGK